MKSTTHNEKFEVIIPERSFIVNSLEEARKILEKYKVRGITIRRIGKGELEDER